MKYMKKWLDELQPMNTEPALRQKDVKIENGSRIHAVIFDIYGTLIISASGDIEEAEFSSDYLRIALAEAGLAVGPEFEVRANEMLLRIMNEYVKTIDKFHAASIRKGILFPEVDIVKVWDTVLAQNLDRKILIKKNAGVDVRKLAFIFELLSNRVYPMPGMKETILALRKKNIILGIVSNAQFYTTLIMNYFLSGSTTDTEDIEHFTPELSVFSYKTGRSKPDLSLFEIVRNGLESKFGITAERTLFVGNDMYKDVFPAGRIGFRTGFFAGDKRSCRPRKDKAECRDLKPDFVITRLEQLNSAIGEK